MSRAVRIWTKEEEEALLTLRGIYGMNRPTDISYQLKKIYGIIKSPQQVSKRFQKIERTQFTDEQLLQAWELQKQVGFNWPYISLQLKQKLGNILFKITKNVYKRKIDLLNNVFGQEKSNNKGKIRSLKSEAISLSLQLYKDKNPPQDEQYLQVQEKSKFMVELFDKMFQIQFENDEDLFEQLKNYTNKQQIQQMFEHLYLLDTMQNIAQKRTLNNMKRRNYTQFNYFNKNNQKQMTNFKIVKTWEAAENLIVKQQVLADETNEALTLSQNEIQLIKESPLYLKLFPNPERLFLDFYNEAVHTQQDNKKFTYMITENLKVHQVQKEINVDKCERQKQNLALPIWKKIRNNRQVNLHYDSQKFLNDFLDAYKQ